MDDAELRGMLERLASQLERIAVAVERSPSVAEKIGAPLMKADKCPGCLGDGKSYGGHNCIRCGGSGLKSIL